MKKLVLLFFVLFGCFDISAIGMKFPGHESEWHGRVRHDFRFEDRDVIVVEPSTPAPNSPWVWRPAFFDAFPAIDMRLLDEGYHIVYFDLTDEWGRPQALDAGEKFYELMTGTYGLNRKVVMEGLSRGGYYSLRWGQLHPESVACLLLDNPLCDLYELKRNDEWWADVIAKWGFEGDGPVYDEFRDNAIYNIGVLADNRVPILALSGGSDTIVPYEKNIKIVKDVYLRNGAPIKSIVRPGGGHHPHGLDNPDAVLPYLDACVNGNVQSVDKRILKVACIGNSVTEGVGTTDASLYSYPVAIGRLLGDGYEVRNFGVSCSTALRKGTDSGRPFAYIDTERCREAVAYQPDIVVIKLGGNDSKPDNWQYKDEFVADYQVIIDMFKFLPSLPEIYICTPVDAKVGDPSKIWGINKKVISDEIVPMVCSIAHDNRIRTVDLHDAYVGEDNLCYNDNIHPTDRGAALIARKIYLAMLADAPLK